MAISAAIFDCDGTLIDSMWLWEQVFYDLVASHGATLTPAQFAEGEPLSADEECLWLHETFGIGASADELICEMRTRVREAYANRVQAWPGVHSFLDELSRSHIPMCIATSTQAEDVAVALAAQGLSEYFEEIIFAGDVGRSKEYPDVYLEAQRRLGSERASTWVFEDAPFGLRTARNAGFPTVCVYNDHDGRDLTFCQENSDLLIDAYSELSLQKLRVFGDNDG